MFTTRKDLQDALEAEQKETARLEAELQAAQELNEEATGQAQRLAELEESLTQAQTDLQIEREAHEETKAALEAEKEKTTDEAIQARVTEEIALAGHAPVEVPAEGAESVGTPHLDKFNSLEGAESTEYFKKHQAAIREELTRG